jgi:energy-converting hydrogenase Eha subunit F
MQLVTKLVLLGSALAVAGTFVAVLRRNRLEHNRPRRISTVRVDLGRPIEPYDPGDEPWEEASVIATTSGTAGIAREPRRPGKGA